MAEHAHDTADVTTNQQTVNGVVYDVTTVRCSCGHFRSGSATPRD
jgi:hypothetical protein